MKEVKVKCLIIMVVITVIIWGTVPALAELPGPCDVCPFGCTYSSIQSAINAATNGDEIEVCNGTYVENIDFLGKDITLISRHGASTTIIDGDRDDAVVTFASGEGPGAVLSGFTIQNGSGYYTGFSHGGGIYIEGASPTITNCDISSNTASYGAGIYLDSSSASISNCSIQHNTTTIYDGGGIFCTSSSPAITGCTLDTNYSRRDGAGIYCDSSSLSLVDTTLINNGAAIATTGNGGGVALVDSSAVITGCTFSDNRAGDDGGGLWCNSDSTDVTVTDSIFNGNEADVYGGGIYSHASSPTFSDCTVSGNSAGFHGGGIYVISSAGTLNNCNIKGNDAGENGGGLVLYWTSAEVDGCSISDNTAGTAGGGVWIHFNATPTIRNCEITGNIADGDGGGILVAYSSNPTLINTIVNNNSALGELPGYGTGGGIAVYTSMSTLMNCTVRRNATTRYGGGLYSESSTVTVTNSIFWDNAPDEIDDAFDSEPILTYSDIKGGYLGTGNIDSAPFFVSGSDCHIRESSPCIDQGTLTGAPDRDIDGDVRPTETSCDMGADEFTGINYPVPEVLVNGMGGVVDVSISETTDVVFTLALDTHGRTDVADWWIVLITPYGLYFTTPTALVAWPEIQPFYQGQLFNFPPYDFPPASIGHLPTGSYYFFFAVDTVSDGLITWDELFSDWIQINLTE